MNAADQIKAKQIEWAKNRGIKLIGSAGERGQKVYTTSINENLFQPLSEGARRDIGKGNGNELTSKDGNSPKIHALHSSSALGVNIFDYWSDQRDLSLLFSACGLSLPNELSWTIRFEHKYPIKKCFKVPPNIDVVFSNESPHDIKSLAIECKFTEAYGSRTHGGMKSTYIKNVDIWEGLSATRKLAEDIEEKDNRFIHLHAAQLIKHTLGLNKKFGHSNYHLLYLWYDALGEPGCIHRKEVEKLSEILCSDGVLFHSITYQELIMNLAKHREQHGEYISYITERYL